MESRTRYGRLVGLAYAVFVLAMAAMLFADPNFGWDTLGYVASIERLYSDDIAVVHARAYEGLRAVAGDAHFARLTGVGPFEGEFLKPADIAYRQVVYADPAAFAQNVSFYAIRPAYWGLALALSGLGLNVFMATWLISNLCYVLICLGCFAFLAQRTTPLYALAGAVPIALYPPLLSVGGASNPDAMVALCFLGFFLLFMADRVLPASLLLLAAVFVRTDIAVFNGIFAVLLVFRRLPAGTKWLSVALLLLSLPLATAIHDHYGHLGWARIFQFALIEYVPYPADLPGSLTREQYFATLGDALVQAVGRKWVWLTAAAVVVTIALRRLRPWRVAALFRPFETVGGARPEDVMLVAILLYFVARAILFPALYSRLYVGQVLVLLLCAMALFHEVYGDRLGQAAESLKRRVFG